MQTSSEEFVMTSFETFIIVSPLLVLVLGMALAFGIVHYNEHKR
jgi:fumarate reductase subunit D